MRKSRAQRIEERDTISPAIEPIPEPTVRVQRQHRPLSNKGLKEENRPSQTEVRIVTGGHQVACNVCGEILHSGERHIRVFTYISETQKAVTRLHYACSKSESYAHRDHYKINLARLNYEIAEGITTDHNRGRRNAR